MDAIITPVVNNIVYRNQLNLSQYARKFSTTINILIEKCLILENSMLNIDKSI